MSKTIIFFGSGPVAAESLSLLHKDFAIEAVITKPQPEHHKQPFPVIKTAEDIGIPIFTANNQEELSKLFRENEFHSELGIVIDHGIIIAQEVIDYFSLGIVNSHFSLLPHWRGADPITYSILKGDKETGVSLMTIVDRLDEGDLIAQKTISIEKDENSQSLTNKLISLSNTMLVETIPLYVSGRVKPFPQPNITPTYSHKLQKSDSRLDWNKPAEILEREVRAYIQWPRSRAQISGYNLVITASHVESGKGTPGNLWIEGAKFGIYCARDILVIDKLIPAGKNEMTASSFINGHRLAV